MVNATARAIPTVNTNLAGFGFGAMYPSWRQIDVAVADFRGVNRKRCVSCFTLSLVVQKMQGGQKTLWEWAIIWVWDMWPRPWRAGLSPYHKEGFLASTAVGPGRQAQ